MEPLGIHGVSVEASANTLNPLHYGEDEGSHSVTESSETPEHLQGKPTVTAHSKE